jgi:hypothetical protein
MTESDRARARSGQRRKSSLFRLLFGPRLRGVLRVGAYLVGVFALIAVFSARSALGGVSEQALVVGRQLAKLEDLTESSNQLLLNGERIQLASAVTSEPVERVLDRFEALCRDDGVLPHELSRLDALLKKELPPRKSALELGILREDRGHDGMVACMVQGPSSRESLFQRFEQLVQSQDLADVGLLRYAYARRTENGRTHVITAWTEGSFKLDALAPKTDGSDTPGSDPKGAIRPPQSVRLLTAQATGAPHAVRIYESRSSQRAVLDSYDRELPRLGWQPISAAGYDVPEARYFTKGGVDLLVVADEQGERTAVSMIETRSR